MDYNKYTNRFEYPSIKVLHDYATKITAEILDITATGREIKEMIDKIPERVKIHEEELKNKYKKEENRLHMLFKKDALEEAELSFLPKEIQERIFLRAWDDGHSCGYSGVFNQLLKYSEIFEGYAMIKVHK